MILLAFRQGLRAAEVCDLRWEQLDFKAATLHVRRTKNGTPATHPLTGRELRALRRLLANGQARSAGREAGDQGPRGSGPGGTVSKPKGLSRERWSPRKRQAPGVCD